MSRGGALRETVGAERGEIRTDRERVDVGRMEPGSVFSEERAEKRREAAQVAPVRRARVRGDPALVLEMSCEGAKVVGKAQFFLTASVRTSLTSALISSSESFLPNAGILSWPFVTELISRASSTVACHFALERSRACFFLPSSVFALPSSPW